MASHPTRGVQGSVDTTLRPPWPPPRATLCWAPSWKTRGSEGEEATQEHRAGRAEGATFEQQGQHSTDPQAGPKGRGGVA